MAKKAIGKDNLSKEMIENIQNYGNEIITLEDFVAKVRQTPDVYIGPIGNEGYITMVREAFQNALDELMKEDSPCTSIIVSFDERTKTFIVEDNGRGLPHGHMIRIVTEDHTSSNYVKKKGQYSSGKNGMGLGIVNALSRELIAESSVLGETRRCEFYDGKPWDKGEIKVKSDKYQGTIVTFTPSFEAMGQITCTWQEVLYLITLLVPLSTVGATVVFNAIDSSGTTHQETIVNVDGILTHIINITTKPLITPISIFRDTGEMKAEILLTWDMSAFESGTGEGELPNVLSFNNFCPTLSTPESKHVAGFMDGVTKFFRNHMNRIFLASTKKKMTIINNDILCGLRAVVNTAMLTPRYHGQSKNILANEEMEPFVSGVVQDALNEWSKSNPKDLQKICKWLKDVAEIRIKNETVKNRISSNYKKSVINNLPDNFAKETRENLQPGEQTELFIVEGKSPAGSAKDARCPRRQAVFGIRGKFPNSYAKTEDSILENVEASSIISILDGGEGKNFEGRGNHFDIRKCRYDKVVIMTDADEDGKGHIRPLLFKFFLRFMPQLVLEGRLYGAEPPLYGGNVGKKYVYFSDDIELSKFLQKEFLKHNVITDINGRKMSQSELSTLIIKNINYTTMLENKAAGFSVDLHLFEIVLNYYEKGFQVLKDVIEKSYRFVKVNKVNNVIVVEGSFGGKIQQIPINERMVYKSTQIIDMLRKSDMYYILNGQRLSLYDTMSAFEKYKPSNIQRFKGLGEMDPEQLKISTMHPDYNRTLIRYTVNDVKKEIEEIRKIESDFSVLLKDIRRSEGSI